VKEVLYEAIVEVLAEYGVMVSGELVDMAREDE